MLRENLDSYNELLGEIESYQSQTTHLVNSLAEIDEMMGRVNREMQHIRMLTDQRDEANRRACEDHSLKETDLVRQKLFKYQD